MHTYVLDSSIVIEMARQTPPDFYPTLWKNFDLLIDNNRLVSIEGVYQELVKGNDFSCDWAKSHRKIFQPIDEAIVFETKSIINQFTELIDILSEHDQADPYLVAFARLKKYSILANERYKPKKVNIPAVCTNFGIPCFRLFDLFKEECWKF